jgi:hypothetical protein
LANGIDFVGFRNFYDYRLPRRRNITSIKAKVDMFREGSKDFSSLFESYQGWQAYAKWGNTYKLREKIKKEIVEIILDKV